MSYPCQNAEGVVRPKRLRVEVIVLWLIGFVMGALLGLGCFWLYGVCKQWQQNRDEIVPMELAFIVPPRTEHKPKPVPKGLTKEEELAWRIEQMRKRGVRAPGPKHIN